VAIAVLLIATSCRDDSDDAESSTLDTTQAPVATGVGEVDTTDTSTGESSGKGFGGYWTWSDDREGLSLDLVQQGSRISGHHEAWEQYGDKVDAVGDDEISSINGTAQTGVATVTFRSGVSGMVGKGTLTMRGDQLLWEMTTPAGGECYIPKRATLRRAPADEEERPQVDEGAEAQRAERGARPLQPLSSEGSTAAPETPEAAPAPAQEVPDRPE